LFNETDTEKDERKDNIAKLKEEFEARRAEIEKLEGKKKEVALANLKDEYKEKLSNQGLANRSVTGYMSEWMRQPPPTPAAPVEGKARGGSIKPGTYLVGEKGPELITTGASGDVITNENLQALLKSQGSNNSSPALEQLNSLVAQLLRAQLQNNEYARKNAEATGALTGNLFV
jgi:hypothetical protein